VRDARIELARARAWLASRLNTTPRIVSLNMLNTPFLEDHHRRLGEQVERFVREQVRGAALGETEDEQARSLVGAG
jgi:hypothetical protein